MKRIFVTAVAALILCTGCSSKVSENDVAAVLTENVPPSLKSVVTVGPTQSDISAVGDDSLVKFKTQLKLTQPLFESADFGTMAKSTESDISLFSKIEESAQGLAPAARDEFAADIEKATQKPAFIVQTAAAGAASDWYGSFRDKKVIDKWVSSDFKTEVEPRLKGQPRTAFSEAAIEGPNAKTWFAENRARQVDVLQKIEIAKKLAQKDSEIAQAMASAATERSAKESLTAANEKQARQMPVNLSMRPALVGGTLVLGMQAAQAMSVRLEVERGLQRFSRDYQLSPGRTTQVGHLEGWGFKSGDTVRVSNPSFDTKIVTVQ